MNKRWAAVLGGAVVLLVASGAGAFFNMARSNPFPVEIRANALTPLYYPTILPAGFVLDPDSFLQDRDIVTYDFEAPGSNKLRITIQKKPANYSSEILSKNELEDPKAATVPLGTAYIGGQGPNTVGNLVVDDTWISAFYSKAAAPEDVTALLSSLKRY